MFRRQPRTRVLAIASQKGGSGKTTTAVNVSAALAEHGARVLLIDLDPQGSASSWLRLTSHGLSLLDVLLDSQPLPELICATSVTGLAAVPASDSLTRAERVLAREVGVEMLLRRGLESLPESWDFVVVDCPSGLGILTVNALAAARELLVPLETQPLPLSGLAALLHAVELVRERLNSSLTLTGILACRVDLRAGQAASALDELRRRFGSLVLGSIVREDARLAECPSVGEPVTRYAPHSSGARDYRALAAELLVQSTGR